MYLFIGDYHATEKELDDCERLAKYIIDILRSDTALVPVFLGDLYDTHGIIRAEVQKFWYDLFNLMPRKPIVITGNHDIPTNRHSSANSLLAHADHITLVAKNSMYAHEGNVFASYFTDKELFIKECNKYKETNLVAHQTFSGAKYENGFPAKDGIEANLVPQTKIISGHIHTASSFGKVTYVGAPRWRSFFDANQKERFIYKMDRDLNIVERYPTSSICRVMHHFVVKEGEPLEIHPNLKDVYNIDIHGSQDFIKKQQPQYKFARIRIFEEEKEFATYISESDPLNVSVTKWANNYQPKNTHKDLFLEELKKDDFYGKFFK